MMTTSTFIKRTLCTAVLMATCSAAQADFLQEGKIIAGSDITFPPYEYMMNGKPVGFDIEILNGIAHALGKTAVNIDTRFPNLIPGLQGKRFDITNSAMYITPERLKVIDMIPYLKTGQQIVTLTDSSYKPETPEAFCGHKIGTMAGTSFVQNLQKLSTEYCVAKGLKPIQLSEFPTDPQTTQALLSRAVEAQITDVAVAQAAVAKLGGRVEITSKSLLYPVLVGIGVRKDDPAIKDAITTGLKKFSQTPEYQALFARYHFTPAPVSE